jgi:intracellular sulfur oxidation DsrE/DsrF family protein
MARAAGALRAGLLAAGGALLLSLAGCAGLQSSAARQDKVVYHFSEGLEQASSGLQYIRNQLEVDPKAVIVAVAHARGVDFLMKGAKDRNGNKYEDIVERLALNGVRFEVCEITLRERRLSKERFIDYASFVPSGVAEITRLQQREGFAYLKP